MQFTASKEKHKKVSLLEGLELLEQGKAKKLYSDGLYDYEYIYYDKNGGFYCEDGWLISHSLESTYQAFVSLKWAMKYNFYVDNDAIEST